MTIQWFPGHMHATRKAITERMKVGIDVVIELLDARLPGSSANPLLADLTQGRPCLKVLNKQDLADPARTELWLQHLRAQVSTGAIGLDASERAPAARLVAACKELAPPNRGTLERPLRILICGIPNVGKSTLINTLVGKKATKTGDEAGVTKNEQRISLAPGAYLYDTPGMLWPKIIVPKAGFHLAASGAVGRNAYDEQEVALELLETLQVAYAEALVARYGLPLTAADAAASPAETLLEAIGQRRGAVRTGARVDLQKAAEVVINDFRAGHIGRLTLETPAEFTHWVAEGRAAEARRQAEKQALRDAGLIGKRSKPRPPSSPS
jgi:ribosome biogenesis GTPase A